MSIQVGDLIEVYYDCDKQLSYPYATTKASKHMSIFSGIKPSLGLVISIKEAVESHFGITRRKILCIVDGDLVKVSAMTNE